MRPLADGAIGSTEAEAPPDRPLRVLVLAFAVMDERELARAVEQVATWPAAVAVHTPLDLEAGIEQDRVGHLEPLDRPATSSGSRAKSNRGVDADHLQALDLRSAGAIRSGRWSSELTRAKSQNSTSIAPRPINVFMRRKATFSQSICRELGRVDLGLRGRSHRRDAA